MPKKVVDNDTLIALKTSGKSYREIAKITGANKDVINRRIKDLLPDDNTKVYVEQRAGILARLQTEILQSIDAEDIKKMPTGQRVMAYGILFDKERLERGQSTANVDTVLHSISSELTALIQERNKLLSGGDKD